MLTSGLHMHTLWPIDMCAHTQHTNVSKDALPLIEIQYLTFKSIFKNLKQILFVLVRQSLIM